MDKILLVGLGLGLAYLFFNKEEQEEIKQEGKKEVKHNVKIEDGNKDKNKTDDKFNNDKKEGE